MSLVDAADRAREGDWAGCLTAALAAWRPERQPAIADLIDRITVRAAGRTVFRPQFLPRLRDATDADVGELIKFCESGWREGALELARSRAPDPRISRLLHVMLTRWGDEASVISELDRMYDPRDRDRVIHAAGAVPRPYRDDHRLLSELAESFATRPAPPPLDAEALASIAASDAALAWSPRPEALAAIYADPDSSEARLVYADALLQINDPRGEYIALQCRAPGSTRERELHRLYARRWLGPLAPLLTDGVRYRRGFPSSGRLAIDDLTEVPADPAWHTFEELDVGGSHGVALVPFLEELRGLRRVSRLRGNLVVELGQPRWTHLGVRDLGPMDLVGLALPDLLELDLGDTPVAVVTQALANHRGRFEQIRLEIAGDQLPLLGELRGHARVVELVAGKGSLVITATGATIAGKPSDRLRALLGQV